MANYNEQGVYNQNGYDYSFNFCTSLRATDKLKFVGEVTYLLVDDNGYNYVIKDLIFNYKLIDIFTDVDISEIKDKDCMDPIGMMEDLVEETNIVDIIKENAEPGLIDELEKAVDYNIEYRTGIHRNLISENFASLLKAVENKVSEINIDTDSMMSMYSMLEGMTGELTPANMLEAYAQSDMYKKNWESVNNNSPSSLLSPVVLKKD